MREVGNWREYQKERLAKDREAAIDYLQLTLEEYLADGDLPFFLKGLRTFVESQGGGDEICKRTGIDTGMFLNAFSHEDLPQLLDTFSTLLSALKRRLVIENLTSYKRQLRAMLDTVRFDEIQPLAITHTSLEITNYLS